MDELLQAMSPPPPYCVALSSFVHRMPNLATVLGLPLRRKRLPLLAPHKNALVLAWGRKISGTKAEVYSAARGLRVFYVEDGFLRSVAPGIEHAPMSFSLDDLGIYYDASRPSRLEQLVKAPLSASQASRAHALISRWREGRVSKYNHAPEYAGSLPESYVLVVDQTQGDGSIKHGQASAESFQQMLQAALAAHPQSTVLLKVHPDVVQGRKQGHFDMQLLEAMPQVRVIGEDTHPCRLLEHAEAVYTVTSQMGLEGLLWGRPVHTFGMPFYAGWGLTRDALPPPARRQPATLEQLAHAALVAYPRYVDVTTGQCCQVEQVLEVLARHRCRMRRPGPEAP